jgi:SAM-dependent methyltransferase
VRTEEETALSTLHQIYARLEPAGTEGWSPVQNDEEMWHRVRLIIELCRCLRLIPDPIANLRVLDVGCGVGRSSRLLVDLGIEPQNLVAIDFRESAIADARRKNPAIRFQFIPSLLKWPREKFDLVVQSTAFSSLPGSQLRNETAHLMERSIRKGGYIFWWDLLHAHRFADGGRLEPKSLFPSMQLIRERQVSLRPDLNDTLRSLRGAGKWISSVLRPLGHPPTHLCAFLRGIAR